MEGNTNGMIILNKVIASMRPRLLGRGRDQMRAQKALIAIGFNEATAVRPWKAAALFSYGFVVNASMRPRLLGRGRSPRPTMGRLKMPCFNEATAVRPWKDLIWQSNSAQRSASMRPRLLGRGRLELHP